MGDRKEGNDRRQQIMSRRVLSFKLWRDSIDTSVFDDEDLKKLREAEDALQSKFEELEFEPSVSTKFSEDEAKALFAVEEVLERKVGRRPARQPSMTEQTVPTRRPKKGKMKEKKAEAKKEDEDEDEDEEETEEQPKKPEDKRLKAVKEEEELDGAYPSVTLQKLPKGHVGNLAKTFGSSSSKTSSKASIKKII